MSNHLFILSPELWLGEGKIQLSMVEEELFFSTRWSVSQRDSSGRIECVQEIQVKGLTDIMFNQFFFYDLSVNAFSLELENQALGKVVGTGVINDQVIGWEFRVPEIGFEGFEIYERRNPEEYIMRAEYATADQFRTVIQGRVWQKIKDTEKEPS